jgi:hypothetical protein
MADVVYVMAPRPRSGSATGELRFSLRTLSNLPHDRVFISGWTPDWVQNVTSVVTRQGKSKWQNALDNLVACLDEVSDEFVLMNDDFFIMHPMARIPVLHRDTTGRGGGSGGLYQQARDAVRSILAEEGITEPVSYELHVPFVYNRTLLQETLRRAEGWQIAGFQRTLYGNLNAIGGTFMDDCKISRKQDVDDLPFLSTNDNSFRGAQVGRIIRDRFPDPSPYES